MFFFPLSRFFLLAGVICSQFLTSGHHHNGPLAHGTITTTVFLSAWLDRTPCLDFTLLSAKPSLSPGDVDPPPLASRDEHHTPAAAVKKRKPPVLRTADSTGPIFVPEIAPPKAVEGPERL